MPKVKVRCIQMYECYNDGGIYFDAVASMLKFRFSQGAKKIKKLGKQQYNKIIQYKR